MKKRTVIILVISLLIPGLTGAQEALRGSYFSENSPLRNKFNPAFTPRSGYVDIPVLGNLGAGLNGNIGLGDFIYNTDGKTVTALHPDLPAETFLGNLPSNPKFHASVDTDILGVGFFTGAKTFWTFSVGVRADAEAGIPKDFFKLLKVGAQTDPQNYNIKNFNIIADVYAEAALGVSHSFSGLLKGLKAGVRAKFIAPVAMADIRVNSIDMTMGSDAWTVKTDATAYLMMKGLDAGFDAENKFYYDLDKTNLGLAGMGAAVDLGVEYRLPLGDFFDSIRFSASVTDLGFINYSKNAIQTFRSGGEFEYTGLEGLSFGDDYDFNQAMKEVGEEAKALANLQKVSTEGGRTIRTKPTVYAGVELPFLWNRMSVGLMYSSKFGYGNTMNEITLSLNARPGKWFNLGVNYSMLNTLKSIGWLMEFTPRAGINFFLGSDYTFVNLALLHMDGASFPVPMDELNFNLRLGMSIAIGNAYEIRDKKKK